LLSVSKVSSKGQIVIPRMIREMIGIVEGDRVLVYAKGNIIILRKAKEDEDVLSTVSASIRRKVVKRRITFEDVEEAIASVRRTKAESSS
jgi:AbrB family looped-hinge helix DNA binding protein